MRLFWVTIQSYRQCRSFIRFLIFICFMSVLLQ